MTRIAALIILATTLFAASAAYSAQLHDRFSDRELVRILENDGYNSVSILEEGLIVVKINGRTYLLIVADDGDLQAYYGIRADGVSLERINEWNRTHRLSRAYLDNEDDPVIEADLLANGGLTAKHVTEFFKVFQQSVAAFRDFIRD